MGRFGISFSDQNGRGFKIDRRKHYATITHEDTAHTDSSFQRCLAWTSYIVMVLTTYFMLNVGAMAHENDQDHSSLQMRSSPPADIIQNTSKYDRHPWKLRGLR